MFNEAFEKPLFRPNINIGGLFDIPTGRYVLGKHGESILNGGLGPITGLASRPNNFKTALAVYMQTMVRRCCHDSDALIYDTEGTLDPQSRFEQISRNYDYLKDIDYLNDSQFSFTDLSRYTGDEFMLIYREAVAGKPKNPKKYTRTTPFIDRDGNCRPALYPSTCLIDSLSKMQISIVQDTYAKNAIGDSKNNTTDMTTGKAKNQMFNQLPTLCAQTGSYFLMTSHVTDVINVEMYPTDKRKLSDLKKDTTITGVSSGFFSLPNNVWMIESNKPLLNKEKMPQYPWDNSTAIEGDSDLKELVVYNLRGKGGITGLRMTLLVTQTEGYQPSLSEFHYCKETGFGLGGNNTTYYIELCPDISLMRTTVRKKINEHARLRRALEIQSEMLQLIQFHRVDPEGVFTDPKTLYEDLKALGYDWDRLLNTRGYWVYVEEESEHPQPFLSTMDLLRMRKGLYIPYWFTEEEKDAIRSKLTERLMQTQSKAA